MAVEEAHRIGIKEIGFSGGVAYNRHITLTIRKVVEENDLRFIAHHEVPPGDGGISVGQAYVGGLLQGS